MNDALPRNPAQHSCPRCDAPYVPERFPIPTPGGGQRMVGGCYCPACQAELDAEAGRAEDAIIARARSTGAEPGSRGDDLSLACKFCGEMFIAEKAVWPNAGSRGTVLSVKRCDACISIEDKERKAYEAMIARRKAATTWEQRRHVAWGEKVGPRHERFDRERLPPCIRAHVEKVLGWTPRPTGIGLLGPSGTGKSPLIFALGEQLWMAGHEVFTTSGIDFQHAVHRSSHDRKAWETYLDRCEKSEILLIDDADKLNFTPGVEAEYYGVLEHRRNWQLPVLCTLNLSGAEMKTKLLPDPENGDLRRDRAAAIVARLRDLCEFITVTPAPARS